MWTTTSLIKKNDNKLSRLVAYISENFDYYKMKYGDKYDLSIENGFGLRYQIHLTGTYIYLTNDADPPCSIPRSTKLTETSYQFERNDPELAEQLYNELIRVFQIPSLDIVRYVLN